MSCLMMSHKIRITSFLLSTSVITFLIVAEGQGSPLRFEGEGPRYQPDIQFRRSTENQHHPFRRPQQFSNPYQKITPPPLPIYKEMENAFNQRPNGYNLGRYKRQENRKWPQQPYFRSNAAYNGQEKDRWRFNEGTNPNNYRTNDQFQRKFDPNQQHQNPQYGSNSGNFPHDSSRREVPMPYIFTLNEWQTQQEPAREERSNVNEIRNKGLSNNRFCAALDCTASLQIVLDTSDKQDNEETTLELEDEIE